MHADTLCASLQVLGATLHSLSMLQANMNKHMNFYTKNKFLYDEYSSCSATLELCRGCKINYLN